MDVCSFVRSPHRTHHGPDEGEGAAGGGEAAEDGEEGQLAAEVAEQRPRGPGQRERDADRGHGGGELGVDVGQGDILRILLQEEEHEARTRLAVLLGYHLDAHTWLPFGYTDSFFIFAHFLNYFMLIGNKIALTTLSTCAGAAAVTAARRRRAV